VDVCDPWMKFGEVHSPPPPTKPFLCLMFKTKKFAKGLVEKREKIFVFF